MALTGIVFNPSLGSLDDLDGATVGIAVLALDDPADLIGSMSTLDEVTTWEVQPADAAGYVRQSTDLSYAVEGTAGVVRYATTPPSFDLAGAPLVNAIVVYTDDGDDDECPIHFALHCEPGAGYDAEQFDEPEDGLARIRRVDDELVAAVLAALTEIDGGTP